MKELISQGSLSLHRILKIYRESLESQRLTRILALLLATCITWQAIYSQIVLFSENKTIILIVKKKIHNTQGNKVL